ncbi:hypothetical protein Nocox_39520 [Nonomuraea coxensis DSM 45129]|uniref:Uncharacterized protein n=1 Tax=Nonomuraea coxensis DSM 45129 TaxID=1122611 RepID=A0ABX8UF21_9ACTN|nr:hypothetical protein [Nonomuraea coxensis]QYC45451.1 hypothetical protein Nocox_39520 [Nonomuraea coxensis DSM 45129]
MLEIGDVVAVPLPLGGYGACQVTATGEHLTVCVLDWRSDAVPALDDLRTAGPLRVDHHSWSGDPEVVDVPAGEHLPAGAVLLGRLPVLPGLPGASAAFGSWQGMGLQVVLQRRWELEVPAAVREAYKRAARGRVQADLGHGPVSRPAALSALDLRDHAGDVRWAGLDALPRLTQLTWRGAERGLVAALEARPLITALRWEDPPEAVDLSGTGLHGLTLAGAGPRRVALPPGLMALWLEGEAPETVEAADGGRWIRLTTRSGAPRGLRGVRDLVVEASGDVSGACFGGLAELERLSVRWAPPHGGLAGLDAHPRLHTLELTDAYGVEASMLPVPGGPLRLLRVDGFRSSRSRAVRQRYRGAGVIVEIRGAKPDHWLEANLDNPLRDWVDDHKRAGEAACRAYAAASRAIAALDVDDPGAVADARTILRSFVETLNGVEERYEIIDTLRREEAGEVFSALAERAGVPASEAEAWFGDWRAF